MIGLALAAAAAAVATNAVPVIYEAEKACQVQAAKRWDDHISDAATIAKEVDVQCSEFFQAIVLDQARQNGFQDNPAAVQRLATDLGVIFSAKALQEVLRQRMEARVKR